METTYCRLCAELKSPDKQLNLQTDESKHREIFLKLEFLNAAYVEISRCDTVCFVCYDSLNKAHEFLDKVKKAQYLFPKTNADIEAQNSVRSDDGHNTFDNFPVAERNETNNLLKPHKWSNSHNEGKPYSFQVEVKNEIKEEKSNLSEDSLSNDGYPTLNVQDILDAALNNSPLQIYGKDINEREIKTWKDYPWICAYCNIEFLDIDTLRSHSKIVHLKCAAFNCYDCKVVTKKLDYCSFIKHVKKHRLTLRKHCHICHEKFQSSDDASKHVKQHLKKSVLCDFCGETFEDDDVLQDHLNHFKRSQKRKPRRKPGTPITVEDLTCNICNKIYKNPNSLRDHLKRHTKDRQRDYTCERCGKMFYNKGALTSHIMTHDQIKPYNCKICNKSFLFPNMLRRHVEMHSGVKPFSCEQCGRCFRLSYQLNAHKIIHTDSMPYVCQYCSKAFRFKQLLKNHERQHTGDKPYACQICTMEFTNWSNYNKHMKRRHNTDTSKKKITPEGVFSRDPVTGVLVCDVVSEEWKTSVMIPGKRGKKKRIKQESDNID